jgi:tetratricopeptide (TPR) repeat protein
MMDKQLTQLSNAARHAAQAKDWRTVGNCGTQLINALPNHAEGYFLRGLALKASNQPVKAVIDFEQALKLDPERYDAAVELASQYCVARRNADAAALLARYTNRLDNSPRYLDMAATTYTEIGMADAALPLYERANALQPDIELFKANLAACSVYAGHIDRASELYRELLARHPEHQRNHYYLSRLRTARDSLHVDEMKAVLARTQLPPERNVFLYYAIAKELEDLKQWDEAFDYYKRAGDAVNLVAQYQVGSDIALIDTAIATFSAEWLKNTPTPQARHAHTPIFVVGLPRTGTTLTERIIASHSQVSSLDETLFLPMAVRHLSGVVTREKLVPEMLPAVAAIDPGLVAQHYMDSAAYRLGSTPLFIDKLPFNYLFAGLIAKAWPDARIVLLKRDPMDACFSMYKQVFTWAYKFSYSLDDLGRYYVAYDRLLEHWRNVLGDRLVEVEYEALVSDQEPQTRALLDKLGLPFEPACLEFDSHQQSSTTASSVQVRQKMHTKSVGRWRNFAPHLEPLRAFLEANGIESRKGSDG